MESINQWQTYAVLREFLNKVNLINANLHLLLTNGDRIDCLLGDFRFDGDNLFLDLKDVTINEDTFDCFPLVGLDIYRWRVKRLAPSIADKNLDRLKNNPPATFARATFNDENDFKKSNQSSLANKILIDNSVLAVNKQPEKVLKIISMSSSNEFIVDQKSMPKLTNKEPSFHYQEIDLCQDGELITHDLSCLQLPASNNIELVRRKRVCSSEELHQYVDQCRTIVDKLSSESMIGFAVIPQNDENLLNSYNSTLEYVQSLNRPLFMTNVLSNLQYVYFCFSNGETNYAFMFTNLDEEDERINAQVFDLLKPLFESCQTQKVVCGCSLMSGILWHKYRITLANVCDLQLVDRQIQKINIFHRKRPYNKYAPPPDVQLVRTCSRMVKEYLTLTLIPLAPVTNWAYYTNKVANTIRLNVVFLRELSARMNYELMHYMFAYSNRAILSLRSANEKEFYALTQLLTLEDYYKRLLDQPPFDAEKGIHFKLDLNQVFPLRYYDPNVFINRNRI